jgi:type I restriction enzyme, S subunit
MRKEKLGNISDQIRGITYEKSQAILDKRQGYFPLLRANNIYESLINVQSLIFVPKNLVKDKQILRKGDILIAASSGSLNLVGKAAMLEKDFEGSFGAFCKVLRPNQKFLSLNYFKFFFETDYYKKTIINLAAGANINNLKTEHLDELEIPLPSLSTQRKIAEILDTADSLRQKDKALLEKYNQLSQSLFLEMFGDGKSKN